ncbi:MAG: hypothetical protein MJE68_21310 [Proteobacteria bacterium]|nr:hypothetical protein [Pseudomonadota bacterium]
MADANTQSAPMEATMTVKETTEKRLNTAERKAESAERKADVADHKADSADRKAESADRKADVLDASKLSWKRGITIYLTSMAFVLTLAFGYLEMRFNAQEDRLRVVELNQAKSDAREELILQNQQEILKYIRSQPQSQ